MKRGPLADTRRDPMPPEQIERLVRARLDGLTWAELALRFGRSQRQVRYAFSQASLALAEKLLGPRR